MRANESLDLQHFLRESEAYDERVWSLSRQVWLGGLCIVFYATAVQNAFIFVKLDFFDRSSPILRQLSGHIRYGMDPSMGATLSIGLLAAVTTLAVAAVAASWRPDTPDLPTEVSVRRSVSVFVNTGRMAAGLTVAIAVLVLPDLGTAFLCLMVALLATLVSVAVSERENARDRAVSLAYAHRGVAQASRAAERFTSVHPWARVHRRREVLAYYLAPWISLPVLVSILFALHVGLYQDLRAAGRIALVWALVGSLSAVFASTAAGLAGLAVRARWESDSRGEAWMWRAAAAAVMTPGPLIGLAMIWRAGQPVAIVLLISLLVLPPVILVGVLSAGRRGLGPGRALWTATASRLAHEVDRARTSALEAQRRVEETQQAPLSQQGAATCEHHPPRLVAGAVLSTIVAIVALRRLASVLVGGLRGAGRERAGLLARRPHAAARAVDDGLPRQRPRPVDELDADQRG